MYFEIVRTVVQDSLDSDDEITNQDRAIVLSGMREHLTSLEKNYRRNEPNIEYTDPLCRFAYLYRYAGAHATLFEKVIHSSDIVRQVCPDKGGVLQVCAVGGGPGTELLGLSKYLLTRISAGDHCILPARIDFTVLDNIHQWTETWRCLARTIDSHFQDHLAALGLAPPTIAPMFLPFDVLDVASYRNYSHLLDRPGLVVFNHLFSENKTRLGEAGDAVRHLSRVTPRGSVFVVIDRLERVSSFRQNVLDQFQSVFEETIECQEYGATMDLDEDKSVMGSEFLDALGVPRLKFFTHHERHPTVFWFTLEN